MFEGYGEEAREVLHPSYIYGVENLEELQNLLTMVKLLSHGGSYPRGEA